MSTYDGYWEPESDIEFHPSQDQLEASPIFNFDSQSEIEHLSSQDHHEAGFSNYGEYPESGTDEVLSSSESQNLYHEIDLERVFFEKVSMLKHQLQRERDDNPSYYRPNPWSEMDAADQRSNALQIVRHTILEQLDLIAERAVALRGCRRKFNDPRFVYPTVNDLRNVSFHKTTGLVPEARYKIQTVTSMSKMNQKYFRILNTLIQIHRLLLSDQMATKRELFYQTINLYKKQSSLDDCVSTITTMLQIPRNKLHILATSKGLVAGNVKFTNEEGMTVDCFVSDNGELVPQNVDGIVEIVSSAVMVLLIEKDATFQKLKQDPFLMSHSIMITAKGMPDLNTRQLLHKIWLMLALPIFGIFDADPYGIEIMLVYKYGSRACAWCAEPLAVPQLKWLGVHPSDLEYLDEEMMKPLSAHDRSKLKSLLSREYLSGDQQLLDELEMMLEVGCKSEIQNIDKLSTFILDKIQNENWI